METKVSEVSWNSLNSLSSGDELDLSGFGSFSDFLAQSNQDLDPTGKTLSSGTGVDAPQVEKEASNFQPSTGSFAKQAFGDEKDEAAPQWGLGYQDEQSLALSYHKEQDVLSVSQEQPFSYETGHDQKFAPDTQSYENSPSSPGYQSSLPAQSYQNSLPAQNYQESQSYSNSRPTQSYQNTLPAQNYQESQSYSNSQSYQNTLPAQNYQESQSYSNSRPTHSYQEHLTQGLQKYPNSHSYQEQLPTQSLYESHNFQNSLPPETYQTQSYQNSLPTQNYEDSRPTQNTLPASDSFSTQSYQNSLPTQGYQDSFGRQVYQDSFATQSYQTSQSQNESFSYQAGQTHSSQGYQVPEYPGWTYNYQTSQWEQSAGYYQNQQYGKDYTSFTSNGSLQDFNSYSSHYQYGQPTKYSVSAPKTQDEALRSTAGRPPCTVTAFGFGGRLVIMKPNGVEQVPASQLQVLQMTQLADFGLGYGHSSGPLAGNASMKDVMKWLDEKASKVECSGAPNLASLQYLWGMLRICCQHYGNLRSTVNVAAMGKQDENGPEVALAKLLQPSKAEQSWTIGSRCLQATPTEHQMQATAFEVKRLLIAGKQKEALRAAQEGQLWGCALLMARQLGEKFYSDTIAEMARRQFQPGFPLRTLTLLYAGQHAGVFVGNTGSSNVTPPQPQSDAASTVDVATQDAVEGMLEEWQENLAIMAANRTNGDERVIMYLGDCLWRLRNEICGAHICYLVANASFEPFSSSARLCLIGADHSKYPRTYATPEAIQRTEVYEFARVTGNSQFILLPFQPYKLIYASMLAEAGRVNEALRYCQAVLKTLKTAGHGADLCKDAAVALEERLRIHSQGGQPSIVQRFFGNIGLHKMMPSKAPDNADTNTRPSTASSRSSVSLAPSASMEPISDIIGRSNMPVRSISEPDLRPAQTNSPTKGTPSKGVFSSFVQKAMGYIRTPAKEAKLGDNNKFIYDETLMRWVEEGAEAQAQELALPPPPMNKMSVSREEVNKPVSREAENGVAAPITPERPQAAVSGIPPMPPSSNQYSARSRQNVRSRYVDTFNKGSVATSTTSSVLGLTPSRGSALPPAPAKFFVPAAAPEVSSHVEQEQAVLAPGMALSNGNGPAEAAFGGATPQVVQDLRSDSGSTAAVVAATGDSATLLYSNHYPTPSSLGSLPPPPALEHSQPEIQHLHHQQQQFQHHQQQQQQQQQHQLVASGDHRQAETVAFDAGSGGFGDDMQEVEL